MQGQDLPGAIASAALRTADGTAERVLDEFNAGRLVRGYPMRGTVFLVSTDDARWIGQLCATPRLREARGRQHHLGLTDALVDTARGAVLAALADAPNGLPRRDVLAALERAGQQTSGGRGYHLLARFISETQIFYGPWNGRDQNLVMAENWLPTGTSLADRFNDDRIAAVTELLRRYLTSHGPATLRDFAWWTKLPLREIRAAAADAVTDLEHDGADEPSYWRPGLVEETAALADNIRELRLLPGFDEFILGYRDRTFAMTDDEHARLVPGNNGVFRPSIVIDGVVRGLWKRAGRPGKRALEIEEFGRLTAPHRKRAQAAFTQFPFVAA